GSIWGFAFSLAKIGAQGGFPPIAYAMWQSTGGGAILLAICWMRGLRPPLSPTHLRYYAISGVIGIAIPNVNMITVLNHLPVGVVTILVTLAPLLTWAFARLVGQEGPSVRRGLGTFVGFCGALLILLPRASLPAPDLAAWVLAGLVTPVFYAAGNVYVARSRPAGVHSLSLAAMMHIAVACALAPAALISGEFRMLWPPFAAADYAVMGHMLSAAASALMFFEIIRLAGPVFLSQVAYIVTITGLLWGMYLFGERHSTWIWAAMAVIFVGLALVTLPERRAT
ncbi:MAG TPA: DMT family transporter, partial [Alphaproteobacteria bacterium]|nr:DMT family transporter [Alphaproteobacteria bacterium]